MFYSGNFSVQKVEAMMFSVLVTNKPKVHQCSTQDSTTATATAAANATGTAIATATAKLYNYRTEELKN